MTYDILKTRDEKKNKANSHFAKRMNEEKRGLALIIDKIDSINKIDLEIEILRLPIADWDLTGDSMTMTD